MKILAFELVKAKGHTQGVRKLILRGRSLSVRCSHGGAGGLREYSGGSSAKQHLPCH